MLKDYEGYSYEEIGQITGLNEEPGKSVPAPRKIEPEKLFGKTGKCYVSIRLQNRDSRLGIEENKSDFCYE